jgi:2-oxoglutarate dehydrogenase E2 component (dihydrolipoamide succinyltransferase)
MSVVDLILPKLGESIMEATILKWHKAVGDTIQLDETLLDIATDKVDSEIPSTTAGTITEILFEVNAVVPIGTVIARIETSGELNIPTSNTTAIISNAPIVDEKEIPYNPVHQNVQNNNFIKSEHKFYSPLVLNIAQNEGVNFSELETINGTGNNGRVTKNDILQYIAAKKGVLIPQKATPNVPVINAVQNEALPIPTTLASDIAIKQSVSIINENLNISSSINSTKIGNPNEVIITGNTEIVEMDRMRKLIAKHMVDSVQNSPHVTSFVEADVTNIVLWREKVKQNFENTYGTKLTYTPIFFESIAAALLKFPIVNSSLQNDQIVYKKDINIGMATALPSGNLIVPVIKGADQLNLIGLSKAVNGLAGAARNNQLKPNDTQNGTFTVTNVGTFGSLMGTPIINQPQVAILALGAIKKRAVVIETPQGDVIAIRHMMYLSMSYDHRIVDGAVGSQFLTTVAKSFENWDMNQPI